VYDKNNYYAVSTITDAQGHYSTPGLKSGTYHVDFYPSIDSVSSSYISEYYNIKANYKTADPVIVTTPNLTPNINAALTKGGVITGVVKAADTSSLLDDVTIDIYDKDGNFVGYSYTNSSGVYTTIGLPTGNYRLYFSSDTYTEARYYTNQYYQGKASLSEATPVTVNAPLITSGINVNLVKGGSITGTVFMQDDSTPVSEAEVEAYDSANHAIRSDYSNTQGAYQLTGLSAGGYRVHFYIWCQNTNYEDYYNKKSTLAAANQVAVTPPEEIGNINGHLKIVPVQPVVIPRVYLPYVHH
jgi:hypothetical protein